MCMTSRAKVLCPGTATGAVVQCGALQRQDNKNSSVAWVNNGIPQTGVTFTYTINPFGPSAVRVFITEKRRSLLEVLYRVNCLSFCLFVCHVALRSP